MNTFEGIRYPIDSAEINKHQIGFSLSSDNINMTLDVNHRFIDGYFVGQFVQKLETKIAELK